VTSFCLISGETCGDFAAQVVVAVADLDRHANCELRGVALRDAELDLERREIDHRDDRRVALDRRLLDHGYAADHAIDR
jgi:hypothetical protein